MALPGLMAWGADTSMRLAYNAGPLKAAARSAITGSLQMAGATAASVTSLASLSGPLVPFINLSYGYLPLVRGVGAVWRPAAAGSSLGLFMSTGVQACGDAARLSDRGAMLPRAP